MRHLARWAAMLAATLALHQAAPAITLVQDGQPRATIVIRASALAAKPFTPQYPNAPKVTADMKVRRAADDLQHYIEKMSGATLPIASDAQTVNGPVVLVGASTRLDALRLNVPHGLTNECNEEGYVIAARGDTLALAGNEDGPYWGTYYAVSELLNRLGVRWYSPGDFGEVIPQMKSISVADFEVRDKPDFRLRTWWGYAPYAEQNLEYLWKLRNKMMIDNPLPNAGDSSIRQWMPDKEVAKTHPEYFGKNQDGSINLYMPNFSNAEIPKVVAAKMAEYLEKTKKDTGVEPNGVSISPDDGLPRDFTPESMAQSQGFPEIVGREGEPSEVSISEEWFRFVNAVTTELAKTHPNAIVATNGYANRQMPPEGIRLHPNIQVLYASIWADTLKAFDNPRSWHSALQNGYLKRWGELCPHVDLYRYVYSMLTSSLTPIPQTRKLAHDMLLYKRYGIIGFQDEQKPCTRMEEGITTFYIRARTEWKADLDVNAELNEYFPNWYGPAAKPAQAFWDALEDTIETTPLLGHEDRILPFVYSGVLVSRLERVVKEAEAAATAEPYKTHVAVDRHILNHLRAYMAWQQAERDADFEEAIKQIKVMQDERLALNHIDGFLNQTETDYDTGLTRYNSGTWGYGLITRIPQIRGWADMTNGKAGELVAMLNREAWFALDPADVGKTLRWYDSDLRRELRAQPPTAKNSTGIGSDYSHPTWMTIDSTRPYYLQAPNTYSSDGVPYRGLMWYVYDVDVPASARGKTVKLYAPVVVDEAWVWVNGEYAGHRGYLESYNRPAPVDLDVTSLVKPGQRNTIAVRVSTSTNRSQAADGILSRIWLWTPKPVAAK